MSRSAPDTSWAASSVQPPAKTLRRLKRVCSDFATGAHGSIPSWRAAFAVADPRHGCPRRGPAAGRRAPGSAPPRDRQPRGGKLSARGSRSRRSARLRERRRRTDRHTERNRPGREQLLGIGFRSGRGTRNESLGLEAQRLPARDQHGGAARIGRQSADCARPCSAAGARRCRASGVRAAMGEVLLDRIGARPPSLRPSTRLTAATASRGVVGPASGTHQRPVRERLRGIGCRLEREPASCPCRPAR